jgi:hypothetical protein
MQQKCLYFTACGNMYGISRRLFEDECAVPKLNRKKVRKEEGSFIFSTDALRYYIIVIRVLCIRYSMQASRML